MSTVKNMHPVIHKLELMKKMTPSMRYDGKEDFYAWQSRARGKLAELLGMDKFEKCDECFELEYKKETEEYTEYRFTVQSEEGYFFPSVLRVPKCSSERSENGKLPLMICLQGHSTGMHISLGNPKYERDKESIAGGDRDFAVRAVKEGYAALVMEQRSFGECGSKAEDGVPDCEFSSMIAIMNGRTAIGERVWDVGRAIDAVEDHFSDVVDVDRINLMGNSGGGTTTYYAAALEERIKCAMPSCAVCTWAESITALLHCLCNYVPHIAEYFDMSDIGGLIAPRGVVVVNGALDGIFRKPGVDECCDMISRLYTAAGVPDRCDHVEGPGGHRFYADLAWPVFKKIVERI